MHELRAPSEALSLERLEILSGWSQSLRAACDAMSLPAGYGPTAIQVAGRLTGGPGEARLLRAVSRELAEEYGLQQSVSLEAEAFTARFSRPSPTAVEAGRTR